MIQFQNLPNRKNEDWLYTSLKSLETVQFENPTVQSSSDQLREHLSSQLMPGALAIVFVNGEFSKDLSTDLAELPEGLSWLKAENKSVTKSTLTELRHQGSYQSYQLQLSSEQSLSRPVQVHSVVTGSKALSQFEVAVKIGQRSKMILLKSSSSLGSQNLQNIKLEADIQEAAVLEFVDLQDLDLQSFSLSETNFVVSKFAKLESLCCSIGSKLSRSELSLQIIGNEASAQVHGLSMGSGTQHHDHHTLIDHQVGGSQSEQFYKSVLNHKARSVFTGKVQIHKAAQKASSDQLNRNLLLSREAQADSRPQLEVLADDVKATHGSTVGQLQEEEIFYFQSRGISRRQAIEILSLGFVEDLVFRISNSELQKFVQKRVRAVDLQGAQI